MHEPLKSAGASQQRGQQEYPRQSEQKNIRDVLGFQAAQKDFERQSWIQYGRPNRRSYLAPDPFMGQPLEVVGLAYRDASGIEDSRDPSARYPAKRQRIVHIRNVLTALERERPVGTWTRSRHS